MPSLIIEHQDTHQAGTLTGRVLIGRWPNNTVVIDDRAVSRIHAWIGVEQYRYYVADIGSRTGTLVNGQRLRERHFLEEGDEITVGPALIRYHAEATPSAEVEPIDLTPRTVAELSGERGTFFECVCGAPMWVPRGYEGGGKCRFCGCAPNIAAAPPRISAPVKAVPAPTMPSPSPSLVRPRKPDPVLEPEVDQICGVCHSPITVFDEKAICPACLIPFHVDCWQENRGCSAYGCTQVNALKTA